MMSDLFTDTDSNTKKTVSPDELNQNAPLSFRMRPRNLSEFFGQSHLLGDGKLLKRVILADRISSLIFYGPPGTGKTTLAQIISKQTHSIFYSMNAVTANIQDIRKVLDQARAQKKLNPESKSILFIDEIHRFNKAQQDALLPDIETGNVIFIGSTTHNPSFSINGPLISRSLIFELKPLNREELLQVAKMALADLDRGFGKWSVSISEDALEHLIAQASGDARRLLNSLEIGTITTPPNASGQIVFDKLVAEESCQRKMVQYDHDEDYHYDTASAFIKSMRGSDPDAAIYWLAKMVHAGEDPRFIARRIVIFASEDVGNADPQALILASAGLQAIEFVGMPEARIILAQLVIYMALALKSNASYMAIENAAADVEKGIVQEVPSHLRDASYRGAKKMGHGIGYQYPHSFKDGFVKRSYIEQQKKYYIPNSRGYEKILEERLNELEGKRNGD